MIATKAWADHCRRMPMVPPHFERQVIDVLVAKKSETGRLRQFALMRKFDADQPLMRVAHKPKDQ
jgi:hypothetical protein